MTFQRENIPEIPPFAQESWADQTADTMIENISALAEGGAMTYVGQRQIRDFDPNDGPVKIGSDGFSKCSGLLLRNQVTGAHTFSHLEPHADAWHEHMNTGGYEPVRWQAPHDVILIYGGMSSKQYEVERLMDQQFWGPATLRQINLETGRTHWGLMYYGAIGQLAIVRKTPDQSIFRYRVFEPMLK